MDALWIRSRAPATHHVSSASNQNEYAESSFENTPNGDLLSVGLDRQVGYLVPPETPGLGVKVNEAFIDDHPYKAGAPGAVVDLSGAVVSH